MKAGWEVRPLGELLQIQNGYAFSSKKFSFADGTPLIRIRDLKSGDVTEVNFDDEYDPAYLVSRGDFLIGMDGEFRCYEWKGANALLNQRVCRLIEFSEALLPRYLLYGINKYLKEIEDITPFTTVKHLSSKTIKGINFPLPPLEEQQRIVAVLDEAFEGLDRARTNAEANLQNARELFENSLIAIFEQVDGQTDHITLEDASVSFGRGRSRHRPRNAPFLYGGPYPFVQTGDIRNSDGMLATFSQTYSEDGLAQSKLWPAGTICITIAANIAETAILGFDACFPDSIIGMVADPKTTFPEYVEFMLRFFAADLKKQGKGSAQDNINLGTFERATFPFPPLSEQHEIVDRLSRLTIETALLSGSYAARLQSLDDLRQSLLQKTFAGELT